jgi:predicted permease
MITQDIAFALRGLRRGPGFAALAAIVLALAIGANTAMFALVDALLLRPLGGGDPERLVRVFARNTAEPDQFRPISYPEFVDLRDRVTAFEALAAFSPAVVGLEGAEGTTRREFAQVVTAGYFSALGGEPALGRTFSAEEERPNSEIRAVVISHALWLRSGADPQPLGQTLEINGDPYTIVGVAPPGFGGVSALLATDVWLPLGVYGTSVGELFSNRGTDLSQRDRHTLMVIGRLRSGVTSEAAAAELAALSARLASEHPATNRDHAFELGPQPRLSLSTSPSKDTAFIAASALMMAMAGVVLLVACLNLANMFLARGRARRTEIAIRQSLGGGRGRILRQLLTEGFALSLVGGAAGLVLGVWAARWVAASIVPALPFAGIGLDISTNARIVVAAIGFCALSTLLFALGPALELVRSNLVEGLKGATGGASLDRRAARRLQPRNTLVVAQIALSLALVTAAGLFVRSALRARSYQPEFAVDGALLVEVDAALAGFDEPRARDLYRRVLEALRGQPGVESVALASNVPFSSISEGDPVALTDASEEDALEAEHYSVTHGYFATMGLPILRGRDFDDAESESPAGTPVAIVDEPLARRLRADGDVVGRSLRVDAPREDRSFAVLEIVGVVPGVRRALFDREARPTLYLPYGRSYHARMIVHLRAGRGGDEAAGAVLAAAGREIHRLDPDLPVLSMKTMSDHLDQGVERWLVRTGARVFAALGAVAVVLALVGVYGVKSYLVSRRTREIGIRMALGATPRDVLTWMLRDGLPSTVAGLLIGIALALGIGRLLGSALFGVGGADPLTFVAAPIALAAAALLAGYLPSRRATRLAPTAALRDQ